MRRLKTDGNTDRDRLCFVQFLHPGVEHPPDCDDVKDWNRGPHRRKFMRLTGRCVQGSAPLEGANNLRSRP